MSDIPESASKASHSYFIPPSLPSLDSSTHPLASAPIPPLYENSALSLFNFLSATSASASKKRPASPSSSPTFSANGSLSPQHSPERLSPSNTPLLPGNLNKKRATSHAVLGQDPISPSPPHPMELDDDRFIPFTSLAYPFQSRPILPANTNQSNCSALPSPSLSPNALAAREYHSLLHTSHRLLRSSLSCNIASPQDIPSFISLFEHISPEVQSYLLLHILRRCPVQTLQFVSSIILPTLKRDFLTHLPVEIATNILEYLDVRSLCRCSVVSKSWKSLVDKEGNVWKHKLEKESWWKSGVEKSISSQSFASPSLRSAYSTEDNLDSSFTVHPYKQLYQKHHTIRQNWFHNRCKRTSFPAHESNVVTCLQFIDGDEGRVVSASDDKTICIWDINTGKLLKQFAGHEGGVWALQYWKGVKRSKRAIRRSLDMVPVEDQIEVLVSGGTDRAVKVWDIATGKCTHTFLGHTSTVRCLQIVDVYEAEQKYGLPSYNVPNDLPYPLIVTGSRDATLRVWRLPDPEVDKEHPNLTSSANSRSSASSSSSSPSQASSTQRQGTPGNPYFITTLSGHEHSVRTLSGCGRVMCSGSYDATVRVWDLVQGRCVWELNGHSSQVYSVVYSPKSKFIETPPTGGTSEAAMPTFETSGLVVSNTVQPGHLIRRGSGIQRNTEKPPVPPYMTGICISGSMDTSVRVWNVSNGQCVSVLGGHSSLVGLLSINSSYLITAAADSTLRIWSPNPPFHHLFTLNTQGGAITTFSADHEKLVSGNEGTVKLWDLRRKHKRHSAARTKRSLASRSHSRGESHLEDTDGESSSFSSEEEAEYIGRDGPSFHSRGQHHPSPQRQAPGQSRFVRDLIDGVVGVWRIISNERWVVAAVQRDAPPLQSGANPNGVQTMLEVIDFAVTENSFLKAAKEI